MSRQAAPIVLSPEEEATLGTWARSRSMAVRQVQRAQIIRLAAAGAESQEIARILGVSRPTVQLWRQRFLALRVEGLAKDAPRPGRIPRIAEPEVRRIVEATLHTKPANATHWSVRTMARAQGTSPATVQRIWSRHNLKPHLTKTFKLSRDKRFVEKLHDIVGLYLNPPDRALVLCVDEKSQIQALDRTQPGLPLKKGRCRIRIGISIGVGRVSGELTARSPTTRGPPAAASLWPSGRRCPSASGRPGTDRTPRWD